MKDILILILYLNFKKIYRKMKEEKNYLVEIKILAIRLRQNRFFNAIYSLKEKMKERYINEFIEIG